MRTNEQNDILRTFDPEYWILKTDEYETGDGYVHVEVVAELDGTLYRYTIDPNGDTTRQTMAVSKETSYYGWSMEEHDWLKEAPNVKETSGDEPFDVVVENKIKEEKKMAKCDFSKIAKEINKEQFEQWVEDNADDLVEYAEDAFREAYAAYLADNCDDFEEKAHEVIDDIIDNLWMSDYTCEVEDPEDVIDRIIF